MLELKLGLLGALVLSVALATWYACSKYYGVQLRQLHESIKAAEILAKGKAEAQLAISTSKAAEAGVRASAAALVIDRQQRELSDLSAKYAGALRSAADAEQLYNYLLGRPANLSTAPAQPMRDTPRSDLACASGEDAIRAATTAAAFNGTELSFCKGQLHEVVRLYNSQGEVK